MKGYKTHVGFKDYFVPEGKQVCLICEYCSDVFYDATNGPYLFICDKGLDCDESCIHFKVDKENTEYVDIDTKLLKGYEEND